MNSKVVNKFYRLWENKLRKANKNENGITLTKALPTNDAANVVLKNILLEFGVPIAEVDKLVYDIIPNKFSLFQEADDKEGKYPANAKNSDKIVYFITKDARDNAIQAGTHEPSTEPDPDDNKGGGKTNINQTFAKGYDSTSGNMGTTTNTKTTGGQLTSQEQKLTVLRTKDDELVETQLRLKKGDQQDRGGLGTPESRTGETATVYAAKKIKDMIPPKTYQEAREQVRLELLNIANENNALLTKEWVESGLNCLDWMEKNIGIENLDEVGWDTDEGNELVGATDHGTSADMFVKTKKGKVIGISLKKSMKVFIVNGGYDKKIDEVVELLGMKEDDLPEEATKDYYNKQRDDIVEIASSFMLTNPDVQEKVCAHVNRLTQDPSYRRKVFTSKALNAREEALRKSTGKENIEDITCDDFYNAFIRKGRNQRTGNDIKMIVSIAKLPDINEATGLYPKLRALDGLLGDNLMNFLKKPENESKFKTMVMKETHIKDILFGSEAGALDALEVVYGEKGGGVSMSPQAVSSLFGISDLYAGYQDAKGDKKEELKEQILAEVNKKLVVTKEGGKPVIGVTITSPNPDHPPDLPKEKESILPIFTLATRARGIGNAPVLEMYQGLFGGLAFKNGNIDIKNWPKEDKSKLIKDQLAAIKKDIKDEALDPNSDAGKQQIIDRIKQLEYWDSNNKSIKNFKKDMGLE